MPIDIVTDLTRLFRLGSKVVNGEMTIGDVLGGGNEPAEEAAHSEKCATPATPACQKTPGCTEGANHKGGCCINATVEDK